MRNTWTRERVIRHILDREAEGRALTVGGDGVDKQLYSAARRIFGSWRNAIIAAGIPPERVLTWERWTPAKILAKIRAISRRSRPLTTDQVDRRYGNLVSAARRHFGSWSKAALAAGVDPTKMQRVVPWTRERVIEAILTRALRSDPLVARLVEPRSLVEAGHKFFGGWRAAIAAAGLDPRITEMPPRRRTRPRPDRTRKRAVPPGARSAPWSAERVIEAIQGRVCENLPINAWAVSRDHSALYRAGIRLLESWDDAIRAAGLDPDEHRRRRPAAAPSAARKSQGDDTERQDRSG
jgi:hypothetical protein